MFFCLFFFFFLVSSSAAFFFSTPTYTYILIHGKEFGNDWINWSTQMLSSLGFQSYKSVDSLKTSRKIKSWISFHNDM